MKLKNTEWGKFKMNNLFDILTYKKRFDANKVNILPRGKYPYVVRMGTNNGQRGYIQEDKKFLNDENTISFGQDTATMFYQEFPYFTGDKIKILRSKNHCFNKNNAQFFITCMSKAFSNFSWGNTSFSIETIGSQEILLPTIDSNIDFDFIENLTADIEFEYINRIKCYLTQNNLNDTNLTAKEKESLNKIKNVSWKLFKIEEVLTWQQGVAEINPLHLDKLSVSNSKKYPFYGQSTTNNGVIEYRHLVNDVLNNKQGKPTILIHSNNQNTVYLETPFYLKDGHGATSVLQCKNLNKLTAHFLISCIVKVIQQKFHYNAKATKIELKRTEINLPIKDGKPDYEFMEHYISAIQKLSVKNVISYLNRKMT